MSSLNPATASLTFGNSHRVSPQAPTSTAWRHQLIYDNIHHSVYTVGQTDVDCRSTEHKQLVQQWQ